MGPFISIDRKNELWGEENERGRPTFLLKQRHVKENGPQHSKEEDFFL